MIAAALTLAWFFVKLGLVVGLGIGGLAALFYAAFNDALMRWCDSSGEEPEGGDAIH